MFGYGKKGMSAAAKSKPGQFVGKQVKEYAPAAGTGLALYGAGVYTNEQRRKAKSELADAQTAANLTVPSMYEVTDSAEFADSLRTSKQKDYLETIKDPKKKEILSKGIDNFNVTNWYQSDPLLKDIYPKKQGYRKNLYDQGKLKPWSDDPNIVNPEWNK